MLAESAVLGAFLAQDLILFVAFFDLMLIPFYFLIGGWGRDPEGSTRVRATTKLVIYTLVGSLLMLAGAVATGVLAAQQNGGNLDFAFTALQHAPLATGLQEWIFLLFAAAFLVKMPAFPLPRLDARRLPRDADRGADGVLRRALEGRAPTASSRSC